jgi:hypothetical protein
MTMKRSKTATGEPVDPFWKTGCWHTCYDCRHKFHCVGDPSHVCGSGPRGRNVCPKCGSTKIRTDSIRHTRQWQQHPQVRAQYEAQLEGTISLLAGQPKAK